MVETGRKKPKEDLPFFSEAGGFIPLKLAEEIQNVYCFATHEQSGELYVYEDGIYTDRGEIIAREESQYQLGKYVRTKYVNETVACIKRATYTPPKKFGNPKSQIAVQNGLLDVKKGELQEFSPGYIHLSKINAKYYPEKDCPKIKKFISQIVAPDNVPLIQEMFGYCLLRDYPLARAFMLLGGGANGKSTLLELLTIFLGEDNVANPSLQQLLSNRFASIDLWQKLANIHADLSPEALENTGTFKMLTGGDMIRGEKKHKDAITFYNHAKLIYSANELPRTQDRTRAFFRRWILINFPNTFVEGDNADEKLPYSIIDEDEMSGLLNWALEGLERLLKNHAFSQTTSREEIKKKWIMQTDSLRAFLDVATETGADLWISKNGLYDVLRAFCDDNNIYIPKKGQVTKRLPTLRAAVDQYRPEVEGERIYAWRNLCLTQKFIQKHDYVQDVQPMCTYLIATGEGSSINKVGQERLDMVDIEDKAEDEGKSMNTPSDVILDFIKDFGSQVTKRDLELDEDIAGLGLRDEDLEKILGELMQKGDIYEPKPGEYMITERGKNA